MNIIISELNKLLPKIGISIIILIVGFMLIKRLTKMVTFIMKKSKIDETLNRFIISIISISIRIMLLITVASFLGVPMSSFLAVFGAASLAIAFALRDSLANLAGCLIILYARPFSIGDFIEISGSIGTVVEIELLFTSFNTPENKRVYIPNGQVINSKVINYSKEPLRRIDIIVTASYKDDIELVKNSINSVIQLNSHILTEPESIVRVIRHGDSAIEYIVKVWCKKDNYWAVHHDLHEDIKKKFDQENITIPFPQRDVHYYTDKVIN